MTGKRRREKRKNSVLFKASLIFLALALLTGGARAKQVYMFRDSKGVVHFTDAPTDTRFQPFEVKAKLIIGAAGPRRIDPALLKPYILAAGRQYRLDPALITAVIRVESAFDPNAVSWAGAQGLMQLMPGTASMMGVRNVFSPRENIFGGSKYLRCMLDRFKGNLKLSLAAYNIGPERVAREKKIPNVRETQAYVKRVLLYYNQYKKKK